MYSKFLDVISDMPDDGTDPKHVALYKKCVLM